LSSTKTIKTEATGVLGKLYDAADYPDKNTLRRRYAFETKIQPMPASTGLLELGLEPEEADAFRRKLEADMADTFPASQSPDVGRPVRASGEAVWQAQR